MRVYPFLQKREAIRTARRVCRKLEKVRQADVYLVQRGERALLLYQCHYSAKLGRIVVEEL